MFGQFDRLNADDEVIATTPVIVQSDKFNKPALAMPIEDERLKDAAWAFVASGPAKNEIWAILDRSLDDDQPDIVLVHLIESHWSVQVIHKPIPDADFDSFSMNRDGHGRLTLYAQSDSKAKRTGGFYTFRTTDSGKSWSDERQSLSPMRSSRPRTSLIRTLIPPHPSFRRLPSNMPAASKPKKQHRLDDDGVRGAIRGWVRDDVAYILPMATFLAFTWVGGTWKNLYVASYAAKAIVVAVLLIVLRRKLHAHSLEPLVAGHHRRDHRHHRLDRAATAVAKVHRVLSPRAGRV